MEHESFVTVGHQNTSPKPHAETLAENGTPTSVRLTALVGMTVVIVGLLVPLPDGGPLSESLRDFLHAPVFAGVMLAATRLLLPDSTRRSVGKLVLVWMLVTIAGIATEFLQSLTGRTASWSDAMADAAGAGAALLAMIGVRQRRRIARLASFAAAIAVIPVLAIPTTGATVDAVEQRFQFPVISSFETERELRRWATTAGSLERTRDGATHGQFALRVRLQPEEYPTLSMVRTISDWSGFSHLELDLTNPRRRDLELIVKIQTGESQPGQQRRRNFAVTLTSGVNHVRLALRTGADYEDSDSVSDGFDPGRVFRFQVFAIEPAAPVEFLVDGIRLTNPAHRDSEPRDSDPVVSGLDGD